MIVPRKRSNLICGCGGIGRRARLRILCSQDMQVRVLSTAPWRVFLQHLKSCEDTRCDCNNHRVFSYHFAGIKTERQIRKHRKQSKNLKKTCCTLTAFPSLHIEGEKEENAASPAGGGGRCWAANQTKYRGNALEEQDMRPMWK